MVETSRGEILEKVKVALLQHQSELFLQLIGVSTSLQTAHSPKYEDLHLSFGLKCALKCAFVHTKISDFVVK